MGFGEVRGREVGDVGCGEVREHEVWWEWMRVCVYRVYISSMLVGNL